MSNEKPRARDRPQHEWLPKMVLTFLVFFVLVFVVYMTMAGMGEGDLETKRMWALLVAMVLLVLLPVVDRIQEISVSPTGFEAKLSETKVEALKEVDQMDQDVAEEARHQILEARDASEVKAAQAAAAERAVAVELNVSRVLATVKQAIEQKRKLHVSYKPDPQAPMEAYLVAPFDIEPGKTRATRANDYLWAYSYEREHVVSLRLGRVLGAELS
ncbi:MAG: hypothetical protein IMY86_03295, partial [Chloroflexi bacterium]|nr:hypothetical protein [Chloroflexota bacterium]